MVLFISRANEGQISAIGHYLWTEVGIRLIIAQTTSLQTTWEDPLPLGGFSQTSLRVLLMMS